GRQHDRRPPHPLGPRLPDRPDRLALIVAEVQSVRTHAAHTVTRAWCVTTYTHHAMREVSDPFARDVRELARIAWSEPRACLAQPRALAHVRFVPCAKPQVTASRMSSPRSRISPPLARGQIGTIRTPMDPSFRPRRIDRVRISASP